MNEVFRHSSYTAGSEAERAADHACLSRRHLRRRGSIPWDSYFGFDLTPLLTGMHALDLGCFTGGRAVAWYERYGLASISGVDTDDVFIEAARAFARTKNVPATFLVGRGEQLPMDDETFDALLSFDVLEHVQDPARVLTESRRVLRPGGRAFLVFPGFFHPFEHHLSHVTTAPFIHYFFKPGELLEAYCAVLDERGDAAEWYSRHPRRLRSWERGNTINGLTLGRFRRLASEAGLTIERQVRKPLGSVGRRAARSGLYRLPATLLYPLARLPLIEESVLHRGVFVLRRP